MGDAMRLHYMTRSALVCRWWMVHESGVYGYTVNYPKGKTANTHKYLWLKKKHPKAVIEVLTQIQTGPLKRIGESPCRAH